MSKKKKNIRRKKSNNLLKGVAAAGAVVGGGTIFAGNNAVYAAELDNESQVSDLSESQASTSSYMSESLSQSDSTTVDYASIENSTNVSVFLYHKVHMILQLNQKRIQLLKATQFLIL